MTANNSMRWTMTKTQKISLAVLSVLLSQSPPSLYGVINADRQEKEEFDNLLRWWKSRKNPTMKRVQRMILPNRAGSVRAVCTEQRLHRLAVYRTQLTILSCTPRQSAEISAKVFRRIQSKRRAVSGLAVHLRHHLIVYGHNMKNGTMFSAWNYTDPAFCASIRS